MTDLDKIRNEIAEENRKHDELLQTLEIPSYTGRRLQAQWVKIKFHKDGDSYWDIEGTTGWTAGCSEEVFNALEVGDPYVLETANGNTISGFLIKGQWYDRKSDQDLDREHQRWREETERKNREHYEAHKDEWEGRFEALPDWVKGRLKEIRENNSDFDAQTMGFGYELVASELAVMYAAMGDVILDKDIFTVDDSDEIKKFADEHGTSGTQHSWALGYAKTHLRGDV